MRCNFNIEETINNPLGNDVVLLIGNRTEEYTKRELEKINDLLDKIGELSSEAQELNSTITTGSKFFGSDQRIYMKCNNNIFKGFIKVGEKHLFIYDESGNIKEINPLCVLDFYTYEKCQRKGVGKDVFTAMINYENVEPRKLGYDKPSSKFLNFLNKYYGLQKYVPQNNNYVVFNDYFYTTNNNKVSNKYKKSSYDYKEDENNDEVDNEYNYENNYGIKNKNKGFNQHTHHYGYSDNYEDHYFGNVDNNKGNQHSFKNLNKHNKGYSNKKHNYSIDKENNEDDNEGEYEVQEHHRHHGKKLYKEKYNYYNEEEEEEVSSNNNNYYGNNNPNRYAKTSSEYGAYLNMK